MYFSIAALVACAGAVQAFKDTSPFLLFSSSPLPKELSDVTAAQLQSHESILEITRSFLKNCPSEVYYIITQPSLSSSDISSPDAIPHLRRAITNPRVHSRYAVSEVAGLKEVREEDLVKEIDSQCGEKRVVVTTTLADLPAAADLRLEALADNDALLYTHLQSLESSPHYTVIYLTTPPSTPITPSAEDLTYLPEFETLEHLDLKRNLRVRVPPKTKATDALPLFEKYQFLTPGLFMGLFVGLILISILSVGISAISSLQVSYAAFDKEMGPTAQKKQQQ